MSDRFEQIAERYLNVKLRAGKEFMCGCPFCSGSDCLQFNVEKGLWVCFSCELGGTAKSLVKRLGGTYSDPAVSVEVLRSALDGLHIRQRDRDNVLPVLPESTLLRYTGGKPHRHWTEERGYDSSTISKWKLGYDPLSDRCTIPYRTPDGDLLGVIQRRLDDVFPRYLYPKGFDRSGSLFGSWEAVNRGLRQLALVEGSTDVINNSQAGVPSVAQFGSTITTQQIRLLKRIGIRSVVLFYDYDIAGRKAERQAREAIDGILLKRVIWDSEKYCWHQKLCGCGEHNWKTIGKCRKPDGTPTTIPCECGRIHNMDPGKLEEKEANDMYRRAKPVGRIKWQREKSARPRSARKRRSGD